MPTMTLTETYWKRIRKGFVLITVIMGCIFAFLGLSGLGIVKGLVFAVIITGVWTFFLAITAIIDFMSLQKAFQKYGTIDISLQQHREFEGFCNKESGFEFAFEALKQIKGIRGIEVDKSHGIIEAQTRLLWSNQRAMIKIKIREAMSEKVLFSISSAPRLKSAIFDQAHNYTNVEKLSALIHDKLNRDALPNSG